MVISVESENQNEVRRTSFLNRIRLHPSKLPSIIGKLYLYMFLLTYSVCVCVCVCARAQISREEWEHNGYDLKFLFLKIIQRRKDYTMFLVCMKFNIIAHVAFL